MICQRRKSQWISVPHMQHCQFFHKSKIKKGKFTHLGGSSVKIHQNFPELWSQMYCNFLWFTVYISCACMALANNHLSPSTLTAGKLLFFLAIFFRPSALRKNTRCSTADGTPHHSPRRSSDLASLWYLNSLTAVLVPLRNCLLSPCVCGILMSNCCCFECSRTPLLP